MCERERAKGKDRKSLKEKTAGEGASPHREKEREIHARKRAKERQVMEIGRAHV